MTATIAQLGDRARLHPVWLVEITLKNSGPTLYFATRNVNVGSQRYENYLLEVQGVGDELRRVDSSGLNTRITLSFANKKFKTHKNLIEIGDTYPFNGADTVLKQVYIDDDGNPSSDVKTWFKGKIDQPDNIVRNRSFDCKLSSRLFFLTLTY